MANAERRRQIFGMIIFMLIVISFSTANINRVSASGGSSWYKKVLSSKKGSYKVRFQTDHKIKTKRVYRKNFSYYKLVDLNEDGVKELLLMKPATYKNNLYQVLLLTYYKKKVKPLLCFSMNGNRGAVSMRGNLLVLHNSGSDFYYTMELTVKKGKLKKVRDFRYQRDAPNKDYVSWYFYNGDRVSKETMMLLYDEYPMEDLPLVEFKKIK